MARKKSQKRQIHLGAVEGWVVTHDGETIKAGFPDDVAAMKYLHGRVSYSVDHAVRHEGYDIVLVKNGKVEFSYKRDILGKKGFGSDQQHADMFESAVRKAMIDVFGAPEDPDIIRRSVFSSYSKESEQLKWTEGDPATVLVLTEFAWVPDPYASKETNDLWNQVADHLRARGWKGAGWDSINPGVQVAYHQ